MTEQQFATKLVEGIDAAREKARKDPKSTAAYWNGDDWGSISGIRDAQEWVNTQVNNWVIRFVKKHKDKLE